MTLEEFCDLKTGDFWHDAVRGEEWEVLANFQYCIKCKCTRTGKWFKEGDVELWLKNMGEKIAVDTVLSWFSFGKFPA